MRWGGAGLTALVAVLFVVLLLQVREQGQRLQTLQNRLQTLENANDLGRTNALEEQLRSTVQRLQRLETLDTTVQALSREQEALRQQISSRPELSLPPADAGLLPAPAPAKLKAPPQPLSPE
jgi:TolA-binding protein